MAKFNTTKASKAWAEHSKDLVDVSKATAAVQGKYKTISEKIEASQAKVLNGELLKQSKAIGKALDGIGKQQAAIQTKQEKIDELEAYQRELLKDLKELKEDSKLSGKARVTAQKKNEALMLANDKKMAALFGSMDELDESLAEKLKSFDSDIEELESELKLTVNKASRSLGKRLIKKAIEDAKAKEAKEQKQAKENAKELKEVLEQQMLEVQSAMKEVDDANDKRQLKAIHEEMVSAQKALNKKDYAAYLRAAKRIEKPDNGANDPAQISRRLEEIRDEIEAKNEDRKEKRDARWDKIESAAGIFGLSRTASALRPKDKDRRSLTDKAADGLGLSSTLDALKKVPGLASASAKLAGGAYSGTKMLGRGLSKGLTSAVSAARALIPKESEAPATVSVQAPITTGGMPRDAKGRFLPRGGVGRQPKTASTVANTLAPKPNTTAADARGERKGDEELGLLRRQVAALEKIAGNSRKQAGGGGLFGGAGGGLSPKSLWNTLKKFGAKWLPRLAGMIPKVLGTLARGAIAGSADWIMGKLFGLGKDAQGNDVKIDEKKDDENWKRMSAMEKVISGAARGIEKAGRVFMLDNLANKAQADRIVDETKYLDQSRGTTSAAPSAEPTGKTVSQVAATIALPPSAPTSAPSSSVPMASPSSAASSSSPAIAPLTPSAPSASTASSSPASIPSPAPSSGGGVMNFMKSAGTSLSAAAGKLFSTSKSGDALNKVNPGVQQNFTSMAAEYKARGGKGLTLNSAYRSEAEQAKLYAENPSKAAPPGKSAHGTGLAIDINSQQANELDKMGLLSKYGFARPVKGEAWHLQAAGTAAALAKAGAISADSSANQMTASVGGLGSGSGNTVPVTEQVPKAPVVSQPNTQNESSGMSGRSQMATAGSAPKGSASTIPTFSYSDPGLFIMNTGMLTAA
jgi:hypothetical protein